MSSIKIHQYLIDHNKLNNISHIVFYITESNFAYFSVIEQIRLKKKSIISWCDVIVDHNNSNAFIKWIQTNETKRHEGYATKLLQGIMKHMEKHIIKTLELDDMTSKYRTKNNIYRKLGFKYTEPGDPNMTLRLK